MQAAAPKQRFIEKVVADIRKVSFLLLRRYELRIQWWDRKRAHIT